MTRIVNEPRRVWAARSEREVAHLALDTPGDDLAPVGVHPFIAEFNQDGAERPRLVATMSHERAQPATWSVVHVQCAAICTDLALIGVEHTPIVVARAFTLFERTPDSFHRVANCVQMDADFSECDAVHVECALTSMECVA